ILIMLPLPCACMARTSCFMLRTTPRTLVSSVAAKLSAVWSVIGPTAPSVAALFTATSRRPNRATVLSTMARTSSSLRTSALTNSASDPKERSSSASALPASSRRPATTTFAPFLGEGDGGGAADAGEPTGDQNNLRTHFTLPCWAAGNRTAFGRGVVVYSTKSAEGAERDIAYSNGALNGRARRSGSFEGRLAAIGPSAGAAPSPVCD